MAIGSELWTETPQGEVCILVDDYVYKVIAYANQSEITSARLAEVLEEEYPDVAFEPVTNVSPVKVYVEGKRQL